MKITEKMLLDGYDGIRNGADLISHLYKDKVYWNYRRGLDLDGYNPSCHRDSATEISLAYDRIGTIDLGENNDHPALRIIRSDFEKLCGDEIATK